VEVDPEGSDYQMERLNGPDVSGQLGGWIEIIYSFSSVIMGTVTGGKLWKHK